MNAVIEGRRLNLLRAAVGGLNKPYLESQRSDQRPIYNVLIVFALLTKFTNTP